MNPFTAFLRSLASGHTRDATAELVGWWDAVEAIVVTINRFNEVDEPTRERYAEARRWFLANYDQWAPHVAPLWPETLQGGKPTPADPFRRVLQAESADALRGDWGAMQALAAARETLNRYLMSRGGSA